MPKITKRVVDAAAPGPNRYVVWDSDDAVPVKLVCAANSLLTGKRTGNLQ